MFAVHVGATGFASQQAFGLAGFAAGSALRQFVLAFAELLSPRLTPSIPNAAPILKAIQATFRKHPPARDPETAAIAAALAHPRRIAILTELLNGPRNIHALQAALQCPLRTLYHHLNIIQDGKMLERARLMYRVANNPHPLAKCLLGLLLEPQHMPLK